MTVKKINKQKAFSLILNAKTKDHVFFVSENGDMKPVVKSKIKMKTFASSKLFYIN